ncbi:sigma 54 modulation/S30EA ribosomal C-terminal domain-containing protein [Cryptosporangium sp. NPDC051539]|uniref:sigma 54 modulation/S30EA ribosomal C-terminal domain-containing protein n=1 Tax=Cryptosporangium sp. NPDC051539 TaxID=3363962 RepID=UPI0037AFDB15
MIVKDMVIGSRAAAPREPQVDVVTDGSFAEDVPDYARAKVQAGLRHCRYPILSAAVRLTRFADPALPRPVVATATVSVNGRPVRVQAVAETARVALDTLQHTLRTVVERLDRRHEHHRSGHEPETDRRAPDDVEVHPHGTSAPTSCTVDEAIEDLDTMDREFHLFHDVDTDEDTVVYRAEPTGYRLAQATHRPLAAHPSSAVSIVREDAPRLSIAAAAERLSCSGQPYVFFVDVLTGRGAVLHVRLDGNFGLVTLV